MKGTIICPLGGFYTFSDTNIAATTSLALEFCFYSDYTRVRYAFVQQYRITVLLFFTGIHDLHFGGCDIICAA